MLDPKSPARRQQSWEWGPDLSDPDTPEFFLLMLLPPYADAEMVTDTDGVRVGDILQPGRITQETLLLSSEQIDGSPGS